MFNSKMFLESDESSSDPVTTLEPSNIENSESLAEVPADSWEPKTLKINGKEKVFKTKAEWEAAAEKYTAIGLAATEKFSEAKRLHAEAQDILDTAKNAKSAIATLKKAGYADAEIKSILEQELTAIYKQEDLSPEEVTRARELEELEKFREAERLRKEEEEKAELEREELSYYEEVETALVKALEASPLPKNPILGKFALQYMAADEARGIEPDANRAVRLVEQELPLIMQGLLSSMDVNTRKSFLGKDVLDSLRSDAVQQVKKAEAPFSKPRPSVEKQESKANSVIPEDKPGYIRAKDFHKRKHGF